MATQTAPALAAFKTTLAGSPGRAGALAGEAKAAKAGM